MLKQSRTLRESWQICQWDVHGELTDAQISELSGPPNARDWMQADMPRQVHEILLDHDKIEHPAGLDKARECLWVADKDWVYRTQFAAPQEHADKKHYLVFHGLDTFVDIYLNGEHIAWNEDMFLPLRVEVTDTLQESNTLLLHFRSPQEYVKRQELDDRWSGMVAVNRLVRKPHEDYNSFNGAHPYYSTIGIFRDVELLSVDEVELTYLDIEPTVRKDLKEGQLRVNAELTGDAAAGAAVTVRLLDPSGTSLAEETVSAAQACGGAVARARFRIDEPQLWWPRGYGDQPLYRVEVAVDVDGRPQDQADRAFGFRYMKMNGEFDLRINHKQVKLWGVNLTPFEGLSHCTYPEKMRRTLDMAENANCVTIRAWGPGAPWPLEMFDEADRRGLLVWGEFFHTWGQYPDWDHFYEHCRREAEWYVKTLKHHPSIFMWCGGNEVYMGSEHMHKGRPLFSEELFEDIYARVCKSIDPQRYYHPNCPSFGRYANDPQYGDSHGYTHHFYISGDQYAAVLTENARTATPPMHSLKRMLGNEDLWPEGRRAPMYPRTKKEEGWLQFLGERSIERGETILPKPWCKLTGGGDLPLGHIGPVEKYFELTDTPEGLVYRLGCGQSRFLTDCLERMRRGRPLSDPFGPRRSMGHYFWVFNSTWPKLGSHVVDYYLEPNMAYYALKRAYDPLQVSFEIGDNIVVWAVNDTPEDVHGTLVVQLRDADGPEVIEELTRRVTVPAGDSVPVTDLDEFGMMWRQNILFARLLDDEGNVLTRNHTWMTDEVHRTGPYPPAKLDLQLDGDVLEVRTDLFARCVELTGNADGDEFGWFFEENYFDLIPGEVRRVRILGDHPAGEISAKAFFAPEATSIAWKRS